MMNFREWFKVLAGGKSFALAVLVAGSIAFGAEAQAPAPATPPAPADSSAPPAPAPAPAAAPAGDTSGPAINPPTEEVSNPYGLEALWREGDFVSRSTLVILTIMSLGTWYIMITKMIEQSLLLRQSGQANSSFWQAGSIPAGINTLNNKSAFRMIAEDGVRAAEHHEGQLTDQIDRHSWITMSLQRSIDSINNRMQGGLAFLGTVGSTAPFVGLFGTVWGIYHALTAIGIAGQASIDKVAGPVGEALIMTAFGLFVAVPAVLGYNFLIRRNKAAMDQVRNFSADLHALLMSANGRASV